MKRERTIRPRACLSVILAFLTMIFVLACNELINENPDIFIVTQAKADLEAIVYGGADTVTGITNKLNLPTSVNGCTVTWVSDNDAIQTDGTVTSGYANISVTLTATIVKGLVSDSKTFKLTVLKLEKAVKSVLLRIDLAKAYGDEFVVPPPIVTVIGDVAKTVSWASSTTSVATIDSSTGKVTSIKAGVTTITATSTEDETKSDSITLTVAKKALAITYGGSLEPIRSADSSYTPRVSGQVKGETPVITYSSSGLPAGLTIAKDTGIISGRATTIADAQNYTVTPTLDNMWVDKYSVSHIGISIEVLSPVKSVTLGDDISKTYGDANFTIAAPKVDVRGGAATTVTWSSDKLDVATITDSGEVTILKAGVVTITATSTVDTAKSDSLILTVAEKT